VLLRRLIIALFLVCQLTAGVSVSFAETHRAATDADMSHCPAHGGGDHHGDLGKHGCCSDESCQCAAPVALPAVPRLAVCNTHPPHAVPASDIRTAPLRGEWLFRPPIA
jgi:hypothetical protein